MPARASDGAIVGLVLAGGASRRMGGEPKAFLDLDGRPLIRHVLDQLVPQVASVMISANADLEHYAALGHRIVRDREGNLAGPLAGILAGLEALASDATDARLLSVSTDAPFLPADLAERLSAAIAETPDTIAIAASASGTHPVVALWPRAEAAAIAAALDRGHRGVHAFIEARGACVVEFPQVEIKPGRSVDPFFNVNTPGDLDIARAVLAA